MRIPTIALSQNALRSLRDVTARTARAQLIASDGRKIRSMADDPAGAAQVLGIDSELRAVAQWQRNQVAANQRLSAEDVALTGARSLMDQARNIASGVENLPASDPNRQAAVAQIQTIKDQLVALANTKLGDQYVFAGGKSDQPAFNTLGVYQGDTNVRQAEVDDGVVMDVNHTGDQVFGAAFAGLDDLATQLGSGTQATIQAAMNGISSAGDTMLSAQAETGARIAAIKQTTQNQDQAVLRLQDQRSQLADADPAQAIVDLQTQQTALEQAYAVTSKILSVNLLNFLN